MGLSVKLLRLVITKLLYFNSLLVLLINTFIIIASFWLALLLVYGIEFLCSNYNDVIYLYCLAIIIFIKFICFYMYKVFHGIWRYVCLSDLVRLFLANFTASLVIYILAAFFALNYIKVLPDRVIAVDFLICLLFSSGVRVFVRMAREYLSISNNAADCRKNNFIQKKTLIVGGVKFADSLIHSFSHRRTSRDIVGILTDDKFDGKVLRNVPIFHNIAKLARTVEFLSVDEIMLLPPFTSPFEINKILENLEHNKVNCKLRMVPAYSDIAVGDIDISLIKNVEIEDLLERHPIIFNDTHVIDFIVQKNIMITGAGGSIGSELVRQVIKYKPKTVVLFDLSEYNLYKIELEVEADKYKNIEFKFILANICDESAVLSTLKDNKIDVVYHAGAVKHVPLVEKNCPIALQTNVLGTSIVADCCEKAQVKKMVLISTDKAVNPSSIMGAAKRLAERIVIERNVGITEFVIVRFGNVLGSSGSVIPRFKELIKMGKPIPVTSKNMTRYFMLIPEAVNLVLQASSIGKNTNIMVLQMGQPVKIYNLAKKLIELSGLRPDIDIKINIIGLRPGEKEYEELLTEEEKVNHTEYDRIFTSKFISYGSEPIDLEKVKQLICERNEDDIRAFIRKNVPEVLF